VKHKRKNIRESAATKQRLLSGAAYDNMTYLRQNLDLMRKLSIKKYELSNQRGRSSVIMSIKLAKLLGCLEH
jgi:hypothetical protein